MVALRTRIENAIVALLAPTGLSYAETVEAYNGPLSPTADDDEMVKHLKGGTPTILVTTDDGTYVDETLGRQRSARETITVVLLIISGNMRSAVARTHGDTFDADPGIYQIMEDIRGLLWLPDLGVVGAGGMSPKSKNSLFRAAHRSAWSYIWSIDADADAPDPDASAGVYATMRNNLNNADDATADPVITGDRTLDP